VLSHLVIFDCDGVLVDSERLAVEIDVRSLADLGWVITRDEVVHRFLGKSEADALLEIAAHLGRPLPAGWEEQWADEYAHAFAEQLQPVPGVREALKTIVAQGYAVCVGSSGGHAKIRRNLVKTGLRDVFAENIFSAADVANGKPAPDLFELAAASMGFEPQACVVVEDSQYGVAAAHAAGMKVVGYAGGITPREHLEAADAVIVGMDSLGDTLARLTGGARTT
jgi:HAD superfamily hydrolase (TIGR01509 family)